MELKINKLVITRETYKNRISEIITKIDNYLEGKTNSTKENLTIQKNNYKYKLNRLKQELNELHEQYANGKKEEENMGNKKQMQIDLATVRQKFIMLKKQYSVLKDYSFNLTQYIAEQNETKRDIKQECVDIKEKIQRAKLYINKTKEEGELLQKNEESELYDKRIEELEKLIVEQEQSKRINQVRLDELQKMINKKNGKRGYNKNALFYRHKKSSKTLSKSSSKLRRQFKLVSSFSKQSPLDMTNIKPIEPIKKETVTERKPSIKRNIFKEEPKPIDPPKKPEPKIEPPKVENKLGWLDDEEDNVVEDLEDNNKNIPINNIKIKSRDRRRPFGNFEFNK